MNPFIITFLAVIVFLGNMIYSAYSVKVLREHSKKLKEYKSIKEENLKLRAQIEKMLNVKELERYALRYGFKIFNWEEFALLIFRESSEKDQPRKHRR